MLHRPVVIILFIIIALSQVLAAPSYDEAAERALLQLDEELQRNEDYIRQRREIIDQLYARRSTLHNPEDVYYHNLQIYDQTFTFDAELAMEMVEANLAYARTQHDKERVTEWKIRRSFLLASTGLLMEAREELDGMNGMQMGHDLRLQYYNQMQYLYSHLWQYTWAGPMKDQYQAMNEVYNDSIFMILQPSDPDYRWFKAWSDIKTDSVGACANGLRQLADSLPMNSRSDAMIAYVLARMYEAIGDHNLHIYYLAQSAMADIRSANQDIASLEELAGTLYDIYATEHRQRTSILALDSDQLIARAYNYINVCLQTTQRYNNRVRTVSIARVLDQILQAYLERDAHQRSRLQYSLVTVSLLLLLLGGGVVLIWRQKQRLGRSRQELAASNQELVTSRQELAEANQQLQDANRQLHEAMEQLQQSITSQAEANQRLRESDLVKEEYIGYLFAICSSYISKLDDFRKNINRKAKVKLYDEVLQMTDKSTMVQDELKEFYHNFDAIFLHLYPDFVSQFNALLQPDERIEPKKGDLLNTDLRIYALVRLGINDSVKIAELLHCSPQTIYNNRLKIRSKAIVPKEDFVRLVQHLGHPEKFTDAKI